MNGDPVTREVFWNISTAGRVCFYAMAMLAMAAFGYGVWRHVRRILRAKPVEVSWAEVRAKAWGRLVAILLNRSIARGNPLAGWMHRLIMWGFVTLFAGTVIVAVEYDLFRTLLGRRGFWQGRFFLGYEFVLDSMGVLFLAGLLISLVRHRIVLLPAWMLFIGLTGFAVEGMRIAAMGAELGYSPYWSPVGHFFSQSWQGASPASIRTWHAWSWLFHAAISLGWVAALPFSPKVLHVIAAAMNVLLQDLRVKGRLAAVDVEAAFENDQPLGVANAAALTRKDVLDLLSCTECGRCEANCPAHRSGKILSPRQIIVKLRDQADEQAPLVGGPVHAAEIWACTTCMACVEACPVYIDPLTKILEMRRNEVMIQDRYPDTFGEVFNGLTKRGNPWNQHPSSRLEWARGLSVRTMADVKAAGETVDYLLWVGCSASFDARNQKIARSLVKILQHAGVPFAILGEQEGCTGDPARRIGHEYLFQTQARQNVETLGGYGFREILTLCPHCFNCLGHEYASFGGNYKTVHHTQLIRDLLVSGRLSLSRPVDATVAYHDSCYLGRHNGIFDPPREILERIPGLSLVEIRQNRSNGLCCGSGGGLMWIEEEPGKRVNALRVDQLDEALADRKGETVVASACPFCMTMLEDGLAAKKSAVRDRDIAELVADAMGLALD